MGEYSFKIRFSCICLDNLPQNIHQKWNYKWNHAKHFPHFKNHISFFLIYLYHLLLCNSNARVQGLSRNKKQQQVSTFVDLRCKSDVMDGVMSEWVAWGLTARRSSWSFNGTCMNAKQIPPSTLCQERLLKSIQ